VNALPCGVIYHVCDCTHHYHAAFEVICIPCTQFEIFHLQLVKTVLLTCMWLRIWLFLAISRHSLSSSTELHMLSVLIVFLLLRECFVSLSSWFSFLICLLLCLYVIMTQQRHGWIFLRFLEIVDLATNNKAIVDIRLCLRCALPSPPSWLIGHIFCDQNFPDSFCACLAYWLVHSAAWCY